MKKSCMIISSIIGGAIVGSAITMMVAPKSGREMRKELNNRLAESLEHIHEHIKRCKCMMGQCEVDENKKVEENPTM